ncbi:hypothetical protein DDE01_11430 [Desulfovibrio desulfuricans]|nr:PA2779 family protein [Nitratidesulfovibrio vulgaris]WCB47423.1 PA2779 family protein [Nitratidesulfovibrio vulgaris]GEB79728.1 hypothetical protein DDE01_11430 [Desulfovibrio desulfuricans]
MFMIQNWRMLRHIAMVMVAVMGLLSFVPRVEAAFVPNAGMMAEQRTADVDTIQKALENKMVAERLQALGYSADEVNQRLAMLSDDEVHSVAKQIDALNPGGDGVGIVIAILVVVLLVVLILHFSDRRVVIQ